MAPGSRGTPLLAVTLYREALRTGAPQSWTCERDLADQLGRRHAPAARATVCKATVWQAELCACCAGMEANDRDYQH